MTPPMPRSTRQAKHPAYVDLVITRESAHWSAIVVAACALLLAGVVLGIHAHKYPDFSGFWAGADQHRYLDSARAWARGDLSPALHHYLPLYPMMGAAFLWLTPWQPFLLPDLACLLACLFLFIGIGRRLAPTWPTSAFAVCFVIGALGGRTDAAIWIVPWSTTGSAPFQFASLLFALRFGERPTATRAAQLGLSVALIAGYRPSDAAILVATCFPYALLAILRAKPGARASLTMIAAAGFGLAAGILPTAAAHTAIFGFSPGPYISGSAAIGFEWRLLPMRWVMLVIGSKPALPEGAGIAWSYPWFIPGLAGMLATLSTKSQRSNAALLVIATITLHWAVYLTYRDLQPYGLWRFYNIHYFKWTFPFLVFWAAQFLLAWRGRATRRSAILASCATLPLLAWRPVLRHPTAFPITTRTEIALPPGILALNRAIQLPLQGSWEDLYFSPTQLVGDGKTFVNTTDFKILPIAAGAILLPLRPLPSGPSELHLPNQIKADPTRSGLAFEQRFIFGIPCILLNRYRSDCT